MPRNVKQRWQDSEIRRLIAAVAYCRPPLNSKFWNEVEKLYNYGLRKTKRWTAAQLLTKYRQVLNGPPTGGGGGRSAYQLDCERIELIRQREVDGTPLSPLESKWVATLCRSSRIDVAGSVANTAAAAGSVSVSTTAADSVSASAAAADSVPASAAADDSVSVSAAAADSVSASAAAADSVSTVAATADSVSASAADDDSVSASASNPAEGGGVCRRSTWEKVSKL